MLPTRLYHYSAQELKKLRQDFHEMHWARIPIFQKPHGFWVSIEDFEGDKEGDCRTLPIVAGIKGSKIVAVIISLLIMGLT